MVISTTDLLIYGSYFNTFLLGTKAILFITAEFAFRPKALGSLSFFERIRATFIPVKDEGTIFAGEVKKLKVFRSLWMTIVILLFLRILIGYGLSKLEFS